VLPGKAAGGVSPSTGIPCRLHPGSGRERFDAMGATSRLMQCNKPEGDPFPWNHRIGRTLARRGALGTSAVQAQR
jgi:hypothetical protein